jgi:hypothetical protein
MVVFGGGNEGIVDELHVYNSGKQNSVGGEQDGGPFGVGAESECCVVQRCDLFVKCDSC